MHRKCVRGLGLVGLAAVPVGAALGQEPSQQPLPLRQVAMFSSGVGFFQRAGRVRGSAAVPLSFRSDQVNDILKSLVILDPEGGVQPIRYTTQDSIARLLGSSGKSLDKSGSLADLLRQFQGARVRLEATGGSYEGRILSVNRRTPPVPAGQSPVALDVVNLQMVEGLRAVDLDTVQKVRLLDDRLKKDLQQSLELLGSGLNDQRRQVELRFTGKGEREVKAGYLQETPVWKTSYRLVLEKAQKPYLQGWGIVENTTDEEWTRVRLSLISGRPISFIQDLFQPLYVPRPVVQPQVAGSPTPQLFAGAVETKATSDRAPVMARKPAAPAPASGAVGGGLGGGGFGGGLGGSMGNSLAFRRADKADALAAGEMAGMAASVSSQASGHGRGELFEYAIKQPVTLRKGEAAMVPIVSDRVGGDVLAIYDARAGERQVLSGFRLRNTTGLHLAGGPITVFRDGMYGGDAQIESMRPGADRLLTFSVDPDLSVVKDELQQNTQTVQLKIVAGVLHVVHNERRERSYTFRNRASTPRVVLIQEQLEPEFKLVEPAQAVEKTADERRFRLELPPAATSTLKVVTQRRLGEDLALLEADQDAVSFWSRRAGFSEKVKAALRSLLDRRRQIAELNTEIGQRRTDLKQIETEQNRIRRNMAELDRNNALYVRYVQKLTEQEAEVESINQRLKQLTREQTRLKQGLSNYLAGLNLE